jgi:hypothetical protein
MPPQAATEVHVAQSVDEPPLAAAVELLEPLLHPAASRIDPTAATDAAIAFDARKVKPSPCRPWDTGACVGILARQVVILSKRVERTVTGRYMASVRLVAIYADDPEMRS